mmetsp:Transcript_21258/g.20409  ORF Transcript_21258/g.20409 Transcript_21258/m.20409 type:complete len:114 (+) Transcript_21258:399-740(+)|eukprot:CAMPEP_0170541280 /NCGR_PEP_ID=MMETSP0211-20121228/1050_1 /TAXON_ID=311385 /ORGANISM="Pseudokeronopsis sp., Strain OXSARD2" /LENGTH=113 /DNA_ID=CAMNT_0010843943 /DNA_START=294 /DNA_END=635 /DNA_ORIENTATION=-
MKTGLNRMARNHIHLAIGRPGKNGVISGMRSSCEVVVEVNMVKAMNAGFPFYISTNKVILCPGTKDEGALPPEFFRSVINFKNNSIIHSAPFDYICVYDFEAQCENGTNNLTF